MREDRISELPDSLLCKILLYLPLKDVVRTSVLSTRWRSLWLKVPELDLDSSQFPGTDAFMSFVDRFLEFDTELQLREFKLRYDKAPRDASRFKSWINAVVKRKIEHLDVDDCDWASPRLEMPPALYMSETLVCLELCDVVLNRPESVSLPSLKVLCLEWVKFPNDLAVEIFISCCPVLEELTVNRHLYDNVKVLRVRSETLKNLRLEFEYFKNSKEHSVVVDAPALEWLSVRDHQSASFIIDSLGPCVEVDIDVTFNVSLADKVDPYGLFKRNSIRNFLTMVSGVTDMIIDVNTLEVIHDYSKLQRLPQFYNLSNLHANFHDFCWEYLLVFLESCPNLKSMFLGFTIFMDEEEVILSSVPHCLLSSLEIVEIGRPLAGKACEMKLVRYFLENSAVLKKFTLSVGIPAIVEETDVLEEILTYPRRSTTCEVNVY